MLGKPLMLRVVLIALTVTVGGFLLAGTSAAQKPSPRPKPVQPWAGGAVTVAAKADIANIEGVKLIDGQFEHLYTITPPSAGNAASFYGVGLKSDNGTFFTIALAFYRSDGGGLARIVAGYVKPGGASQWYESRAGHANPPPANSCSSGDGTCDGYPLAVELTRNNRGEIVKVAFYFDGLRKAIFSVSSAGSKATEAYSYAQVTSAVSGDYLQPRRALTTFRLLNGGSWIEPSPASATFTGANCDGSYGVSSTTTYNGRRFKPVGGYHSTDFGTGVTSNCSNSQLWP